MKIAIFSDLHAHQYKPYATILHNGMNSRLFDTIECVKQIVSYCVDLEVDLVLYAGDMFHVRRMISVQAFNAVYEALALFRIHKIPIVLLHGNHDQSDRLGNEHSIHAFRTFCTVVDKPGWIRASGKSGKFYDIMAVPYTENVELIKQTINSSHHVEHPIFLGHLGVQGCTVGSDFVYTNPHDIKISDLNQNLFEIGFLGHYHQHQKVGDNFWYVGATLQHTWGDVGQNRGFIVYDTDNGYFDHIKLKYPEFITVDKSELNNEFNDCFVRIVDDKPWSLDDLESAKNKLKCRSLEIVLSKNPISKVKGSRLDISTHTEFEELLEKYVKAGPQDYSNLDSDYLIQIGLEALREDTK